MSDERTEQERLVEIANRMITKGDPYGPRLLALLTERTGERDLTGHPVVSDSHGHHWCLTCGPLRAAPEPERGDTDIVLEHMLTCPGAFPSALDAARRLAAAEPERGEGAADGVITRYIATYGDPARIVAEAKEQDPYFRVGRALEAMLDLQDLRTASPPERGEGAPDFGVIAACLDHLADITPSKSFADELRCHSAGLRQWAASPEPAEREPDEDATCGVCNRPFVMHHEGTGHTFTVFTTPPAPAGEPSCGICGGRQYRVRPRYPGGSDRVVCPTCLADRLDQIREIASKHYNVAYSAAPQDATGEEVGDG